MKRIALLAALLLGTLAAWTHAEAGPGDAVEKMLGRKRDGGKKM